MAKKKKNVNPFSLLAEGLRTTAYQPTIYGYVPHEKQVPFHKSEAKITQFLGGNRSGKTVAGAAETVFRLRGEHPYKKVHPAPVRGRAVTVDFTYGLPQIMLPELKKWIPPSMFINGSFTDSFSSLERTLEFENGSQLEFRSHDQELEKFAGVSRHFTWFDEEPPQSIYKECLMRLIDTKGHAYFTMTPVEGMTWTYRELYKRRLHDDTIKVIVVDMEENPYLDSEEISTFLGLLDNDDVSARKEGRYIQIAGLIWPQFGEHNVIKPFIPDRDNYLHFRMMDHGFNNPTAWIWGAVNKDGDIFLYHEHYKSEEVVSWHAKRVIDLSNELEVFPSYNVGDPAIVQRNPVTGTSVQMEYAQNGLIIMKGNNDVKAGLMRVAEMLKDRPGKGPQLYICSNMPHTLEEVPEYHYARWATRKMEEDRNPKEEPHKKDDHIPDAIRYGISSRPRKDVGSEIPEGFDVPLTARAVSPYHRVDEGLARAQNRNSIHDWHMGTDY